MVQAREDARPGRFPGTAYSHFDAVHAHGIYDLEVDTAAEGPEDCARRISTFIDKGPIRWPLNVFGNPGGEGPRRSIMSAPGAAPAAVSHRGRALLFLILAELWERFLLLRHARHPRALPHPGRGFSDGDALRLYGAYLALLYALPVLGGALADQALGARRAVYYGAVVLVLGHAILTLDGAQLGFALPVSPLYLALALIGIGTGLLKANISTLVGMLYAKEDPERDSAFSWFYLGINVGAFTAALAVGYVGERLGWHWGFAPAGLGMAVGLMVLVLGRRALAGLGDPPAQPTLGPGFSLRRRCLPCPLPINC